MSSSDPERDGGPDAEHPASKPEEPTPLDVDAAFAAIVAAWGEEPVGTGGWPALEDLSGPRVVPDAETGDTPHSTEVSDLAVIGPLRLPLDVPQVEDSEPEGFVPPDPPPLPRGDAISILAWAGVLGGPVFLLIATIAWRTAPQILILASIAGFVGGFITLVSRMPKHRSDDDDDGAVV